MLSGRRFRLSALALVTLLVSACGGAAPGPGLSGKIVILAAASLTDAFNTLGTEFTRVNPQVIVSPSYAGSSTLAAQIMQGAEADVFASADEANMTKLMDAKLNEGASRIFAHNRLQIVVQAGNPRRIAQLSDLARPDLIVVIGAPAVPVGTYAVQAFDKAGIKVTPKSLEADVKAVVTKVSFGEADAGIVYSSDVKAGGPKVQGVEIPDQLNVVARYPISLVKGGKNVRAASAFLDFVATAKGREVLAGVGFILP